MGHLTRLELNLAGLLVKLANHYTTLDVHTYPKSRLKVNVIDQLKFELEYLETTVQSFNHYTTGTFIVVYSIQLLWLTFI